MKNENLALWKFSSLLFMLALSASTLAQSHECAGGSFNFSLSNLEHEVIPIRASVEKISLLTGISESAIEWAKATDPLFTVIVENQLIPYHTFGPESVATLATRSGFQITPDERYLRIESKYGKVAEFSIPALAKTFDHHMATESTKSETGNTEYWFVIPVIGGATCAGLRLLCDSNCSAFLSNCDCGGWCDCGTCGGTDSMGCFPCTAPPRDSSWFTP